MIKRLLAVGLMLCLLLGGCAEPSQPPQEKQEFYSFTDDAGRAVALADRPQKVAVLFSSLAEIWQLAGGTVSITVGESVERGFCDASVSLVDGGAGKTIDVEALLTYAPDLVIGSADIEAHADAAAVLQKAGIPCALLRVESFADYLRVLKICTDLTEKQQRYETYGAALQQEIAALLEQKRADAPRILFVRSGSKASSAKAKKAADHFAAAMLEELGCRNIAENAPILLDGLSLEEILKEEPDYIFIATMGDEAAAKSYMDGVLAQPAWQALSAVRNGNCRYLPKDLFQYKPNARWGEAYQYLSDVLNEQK